MSHILFVENRHRTRMWEIIATGLREQGHTVSWMVMNHGFAPKGYNVRLLPYPRKQDLTPVGERFARVVEADRRIRHYGYSADHYVHYDSQIRRVLKEYSPEIVIGEATQFYELLTIEACRDSDIRYIVPATARYPTGRFVCCEFDTLEVVGGSGEVPDAETLAKFVRQVTSRSVIPDYMKGVASGRRAYDPWKLRRDWAYKTLQYMRGERYCSPPPLKKLGEKRTVEQNLKRWNESARDATQRLVSGDQLRVLYPLHKQPEASVDVWGRPYSNQPALIEEMARAIEGKAVLLVKSNPKPDLELSDELMDVAARQKAVVPLASTTTIQEAFESADLIVTVTGTIAIESILARKPCVTLIRTRNNDVRGCRFLQSPADLRDAVEDLRCGRFEMQSEAEAMAFAARLYAESYPGLIFDPFSEPEVASQKNRRQLVDAFSQLIPVLLAKRAEMQPVCSEN